MIMNELQKQGLELRTKAKELALAALAKHPDGCINGKGVKQAEVFRLCGLDWGDYPKSPKYAATILGSSPSPRT